jgi:predicted ABC-type ATPase
LSQRPILLIVAGPNGSGKSTLTRKLREDGLDFGVYINPDDIAATLEGSYDERTARAQQIADDMRNQCLRDGISFSFETVMSHRSKIEFLERARSQGFENILYFVATELPSLNVARVAQRVALGGHDVPADRIVSRYHRSLALLPEAIEQCYRSVLFDNTYRMTSSGHVHLTPFCEIKVGGGRWWPKILPGAQIPIWATQLVNRYDRERLALDDGDAILSVDFDHSKMKGRFDASLYRIRKIADEEPFAIKLSVGQRSYQILSRDSDTVVGRLTLLWSHISEREPSFFLKSVTIDDVEIYRFGDL